MGNFVVGLSPRGTVSGDGTLLGGLADLRLIAPLRGCTAVVGGPAGLRGSATVLRRSST